MFKQLFKRLILIQTKNHMLRVIDRNLKKSQAYHRRGTRYFDRAKVLLERYKELYQTRGEDK